MRFLLPLLALSAQLINAIEFAAPASNSSIARGSSFNLAWTTVESDPISFSIYLVNFVNWPPFYTPIVPGVETASGETKVHIPCSIDPSYGYQFNAINGTNLYIIYAQSPKFSVTDSANGCTDPFVPPPSSHVCPPASTATVTVTVSEISSHVAPPTIITATPTSTPKPTSTYAGHCPSILGWNGGYGNAITLTSVPVAGQPLITTAPTAANGWEDSPVFPVTTVTRYHTVCPCEL